jgi:hypothetical protein
MGPPQRRSFGKDAKSRRNPVTNRFEPPVRARDAEHGIVYRDDKEFCGWPFISGFWTNVDGHHIVAFKKKPSAYRSAEDVHHDEVAKVGPQMVTLRSRDNGRTWDRASLQLLYDLSAPQEDIFAGRPQDYSAEPRPDFLDRNVLVASGATPDYFRPHSRAWIRLSTDGGSSWRKPILAPNAGLPSLSGHASSLVRPDGISLIFMTAVSQDGWKRRPVVYASVDGGAYWTFMSVMTPNADDGAADSARRRPAVRRAPLLLPARHHAAGRAHHRVGALPARSDQHIVDRDIRERRRRPHLGLSLAGQRLGRAGRPCAHARRPYRLRLRLSAAAVRPARAAEPGRRQDLGARDRAAR